MLDGFLEDMAATAFVDGARDCVLTVADWIVACGRPDPAEPYRGRYNTVLGRERLLRRLGGIEAVMTAGAARSGLSSVTNPVRGDVGLIRVGGQSLAAICLGERWAVKSSQGVTATRGEILSAWSVPHG